MRDIHLVPVSYFPSENLEFPMVAHLQNITPNPLFYVRNHFEYPTIDMNTWYLSIEELVDQPIQFTYADLKNMNKVTLSATLECAGNKRSWFESLAVPDWMIHTSLFNSVVFFAKELIMVEKLLLCVCCIDFCDKTICDKF